MAGTSGQLGAFGWHQWTQVMVDGAWVDMDATMMHSHFSPGHILASCSALSDAEAHMESAKIMHLIGNLRIEVSVTVRTQHLNPPSKARLTA